MEDESYTNLPTCHLLGSVPAVVKEEGKNANDYVDPEANMQNFPPNSGGGNRGRGYHSPSNSSGDGLPSTNNWQGVFSISSYTQYFNVDTDIVLDRLINSLHPVGGDFFSKIGANPDLGKKMENGAPMRLCQWTTSFACFVELDEVVWEVEWVKRTLPPKPGSNALSSDSR
ncbi:hypothetical protein Ancab_034398 [Ancistrocladus abbreviatus]